MFGVPWRNLELPKMLKSFDATPVLLLVVTIVFVMDGQFITLGEDFRITVACPISNKTYLIILLLNVAKRAFVVSAKLVFLAKFVLKLN